MSRWRPSVPSSAVPRGRRGRSRGLARTPDLVGGDQVSPVALPREFLVLAGGEPLCRLALEIDHARARVASEALGEVGGRFPVFLAGSQAGHPDRLDLERRRGLPGVDPDLSGSLLPERVVLEGFWRDCEPILEVLEDRRSADSSSTVRSASVAGRRSKRWPSFDSRPLLPSSDAPSASVSSTISRSPPVSRRRSRRCRSGVGRFGQFARAPDRTRRRSTRSLQASTRGRGRSRRRDRVRSRERVGRPPRSLRGERTGRVDDGPTFAGGLDRPPEDPLLDSRN